MHIDVYSAMSGISRFGYSPRLQYSKNENENLDLSDFDYLITSQPKLEGFSVIHTELGEPKFQAMKFFKEKQIPIITKETVYVLQKKE